MVILYRYILAWVGCMGMMNVYFCRINLSVAIVAMVGVDRNVTSPHRNTSCEGNHKLEDCGQEEEIEGEGWQLVGGEKGGNESAYRERVIVEEGEFHWSKKEQGLVTGSYFWGYAPLQIPAAWLATRYGFRQVFGGSMLVASLLTLMFPLAARASLFLAVTSRVLLGAFHSVAFPAMTGCWGAWAPPLEKTKLNGISVSGSSLGVFLIYPLASSVAAWLGWEAVFYVTGSISLCWVILWFSLVHDSPSLHPRITVEEQKYIQDSIGRQCDINRKKLPVPWMSILTSTQVWAIILGHSASNWGNYTLSQQLPTYLANVLGLSLSTLGLLASICYLLQWGVCVLASWVTDWVRAKNYLQTITVRKVNTLLGLWVTGGAAVFAVYAGERTYLAIFLFAISAGLNTLTVPGCKSGFLDIAPDLGGIIFGVSNTVANIPGIVAPMVVGILLTDYTDTTQWRGVFWISCLVHVCGSLLYVCKGSADLQAWATPSS